MTDEMRLAYLAGMVDADGSVTLLLKTGRRDFQLRVQVANTDLTLMEWLVVHFGGRYYRSRRGGATDKYGVNSKRDLYAWYVSSQFAYDLLLQLEPLLVIKAPRARLAIEAWESRQPTPRSERRKGGVPEAVMEMRRDYVDQMHTLNGRIDLCRN